MKGSVWHHLAQLGLSLACVACTAPAGRAADFSQTFRGRAYDTEHFRPTGPHAGKLIHADSQGLRITLTADRASKLPVGLMTRFGVRGDFEITLSYEIIRVD